MLCVAISDALSYLSQEHIKNLQTIIDLDMKNYRLFVKELDDISAVFPDLGAPTLVQQLAELAPIFSKSDSCLKDAWTFLHNLVQGELWAIESKLNSILATSILFCQKKFNKLIFFLQCLTSVLRCQMGCSETALF